MIGARQGDEWAVPMSAGRLLAAAIRPRALALTVVALAAGVFGVTAARASTTVALDGSFSTAVIKPDFAGLCPSVVAGECGTVQLVGLGAADWTYSYGPTLEPNGRCFEVDGTFTLTLHGDGSTISGPLAGRFCPRASRAGHEHAGAISYGNPYTEDDTIAFAGGTSQFAGLSGTAAFHTSSAGASLKGTLQGTLDS
jgi:hypothetical protein